MNKQKYLFNVAEHRDLEAFEERKNWIPSLF